MGENHYCQAKHETGSKYYIYSKYHLDDYDLHVASFLDMVHISHFKGNKNWYLPSFCLRMKVISCFYNSRGHWASTSLVLPPSRRTGIHNIPNRRSEKDQGWITRSSGTSRQSLHLPDSSMRSTRYLGQLEYSPVPPFTKYCGQCWICE